MCPKKSTASRASRTGTALAFFSLEASAADILVILDTFNGTNQSDTRNGWSEVGRQSGMLAPSDYTGADVGSITGNQLTVAGPNGATSLNADLKAALQDQQIAGFTISTRVAITAGDWVSFYLTTHSGDERATSRSGFLISPNGNITIYSGTAATRDNTAVGSSALAAILGTWFATLFARLSAP